MQPLQRYLIAKVCIQLYPKHPGDILIHKVLRNLDIYIYIYIYIYIIQQYEEKEDNI